MPSIDYDIASRNQYYGSASDLELPRDVKLLSYDRGIAHVMLKNGMKVCVVPCGRSGTVMMRRLCEGGSRLENRTYAGGAHVLEHADFRAVDWLRFGAIAKNASTSKLFIEHQAYMLLDPQANHVETEMTFQRETMMGDNLRKLQDSAVHFEINNVKDEGLYNAQAGMAARAMIMKTEELLLPRAWHTGWTKPTIGLNAGQDIAISKVSDLIAMHKMFRGASRTTLVMAGPIDINKTVSMANSVFADVPNHQSTLLPLPESRATPVAGSVQSANVTTEAGTSGLCIGFIAPPFSPDMEVLSIMQQLVGMLGSQPALQKQYGVQDVSMYLVPDKHASVVSLLCSVKNEFGTEENALRQAQYALETHVIDQLRTFDNAAILRELLRQYRVTIKEATQSGPEAAAGLAIQGILAANKPSLAWRVDERFSDRFITADKIREVANRVFDRRYMAIVRNTKRHNSVGTATAQSARSSQQYNLTLMGQSSHRKKLSFADKHVTFDTSHLLPDKEGPLPKAVYIPPNQGSAIQKVVLRLDGQNVGEVAYNTVRVLPLTKQRVTAVFGKVNEFGGWASAMLTVAAMNEIAKAVNATACRYKISGNLVTATVDNSAARNISGSFVQPLLSSVAMAAALTTGQIPGIAQFAAVLPQAALTGAVTDAKQKYTNLPFMVQAQTRNMVCTHNSSGYQPANYGDALQQIYSAHEHVLHLLYRVHTATPQLAGTNMTQPVLAQLGVALLQVSQLSEIQKAADQLLQSNNTFKKPVALQDVEMVPGLETYPFMAAVKSSKKLRIQDRASFIVSNYVMVGGMGAAYNHDIRTRGVSYRPSGGAMLAWQDEPVLTLNATFDRSDLNVGRRQTSLFMKKWTRGDKEIFNPHSVEQAKQSVLQQLQLRKMDFDAIGYDLLAHLDPEKLDSEQFIKAVQTVSADRIQSTLQTYFKGNVQIAEAIVTADTSEL